jgi:hypothetical protein
MAIERKNYEDDPLIDIEIEEANASQPLQDSNLEIVIVEPGQEDGMEEEVIEFNANLAEYMDEDVLADLATDLIEDIEADIQSRKDWVDMFIKGMDLIGLSYEERTEPWDGACGAHSTVLSEAVIRFQAEGMAETFPAAGPVKTKIIGKETKDKQEAAERVKADMNYLLTEKMTDYRPEHERMLWALGLCGSAFKKVYFDENKERMRAMYTPAEDVIVPYGASTIEDAERVTHVMRKTINEFIKLKASGFYRDVELGEPERFISDIEEKKAEQEGFELNEDNRYAFYETQVEISLGDFDERFDDWDGLPVPYIVTLDKSTNEILAIRRNWKEEDSKYTKRNHFVHYCYIPGFGFYGLGLIHVVGGYAMAGTSLLRQLVDAGTLSNLPGGLKSRDLRVKGDDSPIAPGEWRDVDVPDGNIKNNIMPLPYGEPSATLAALLDTITSEGRRLGAISDVAISDMSANAPVGTTLALLERTLKPMTAVQSRVHFAMKAEFKMMKAITAERAPLSYEYMPATGDVSAKQGDYALVEVVPVSDPNSSTMAQRVVQYQTVLQMSEKAPEIYDLPELHRQMIDVLGVKNAEKLVPLSEDAEPQDPIKENMGVLVGDPLKAFMYQDHKAHIAAHQAFIQDPLVAATIGQNPQASRIMAAMQAHIVEHLGYAYRADIEEKLGVQLPPPSEPLPEEVEVLLSRAVADAGKQLAELHKQQAAQKQAQQQAQDPNLQLKKMAEETKRMEVQRKAQKDQAEVALKKEDQELDRAKAVVDAELQLEEVAEDRRANQVEAARIGATLENERKELDRRTNIEALKLLLEKEKAKNGSDSGGNAKGGTSEGN